MSKIYCLAEIFLNIRSIEIKNTNLFLIDCLSLLSVRLLYS